MVKAKETMVNTILRFKVEGAIMMKASKTMAGRCKVMKTGLNWNEMWKKTEDHVSYRKCASCFAPPPNILNNQWDSTFETIIHQAMMYNHLL